MASYVYTTVSLATLLVQETKAAIYRTGIGIATAIGLPVSSWQPGDPTRAQFHLQSEVLAALEGLVTGFIGSGFLDYSDEDWLKICAHQGFNVRVPAATRATTNVVLTNTGVRNFGELEPGDVTVKNSLTGMTYTSTSGGPLGPGPGTTLTVSVGADELGSDGSAGAGEIDEIVTGLLGVTCTNPIAATGADEQNKSTTIQQCRDKLGSLSPNGPKEGYSYVARNPELSGTTSVTDVRAYGDSDTGDVTVYLRSASGGVTEPDRVLVAAGIARWATPLCITVAVLSATPVTVAITYELWVYKSCGKTATEVAAAVQTALENMLATRPIGGDVIAPSTGKLYKSMIESTIRGVFPQAFRVSVTTPTGDTSLTSGQVAALGTVTPTINLVVDP